MDLLILILTPSGTNSISSWQIDTSSDLLNPPANPVKIMALSLIALSWLMFDSSIALTISFNSLIKIGFFDFCDCLLKKGYSIITINNYGVGSKGWKAVLSTPE